MRRDDLVTQPDPRPTRKVAGAGLGGALVTLALIVLNASGVEMPVDVSGLDSGAAIGALVAFGSAWLTRERS